jgi:hypothetical protein
VIHIYSHSVMAHLTHWTLSTLQAADTFPLTTISTLLLTTPELFFLSLAFFLTE